MKIHRFIIADFDLQGKKIENKTLVHQMTRVLKLRRGEAFILCDGMNHEVEAVIDDFDDRSLSYSVTRSRDYIENTDIRCVLVCSILKKENFELVVQKAVELGVTEIVPMITSRTVKIGLRMDRLHVIAREAAEQSGRGIVPVISEVIDIERLPEIFVDFNNKYVCHISDEADGNFKKQGSDAVVAVGPEGGFEDREVELLKDAGFKILSLSNFTLRAETAAIVAISKIT